MVDPQVAQDRAYDRGYDEWKAGYRGPNPYYPAPHVPMTTEEDALAHAYDVGQDAASSEAASARDDAFSRSAFEE